MVESKEVPQSQPKFVIARILEYFVGIVFLVSFLGKVTNAGGFAELIVRYGFPSLSFLSPVIIIAEALCAFCLILNIYPRIVSAITGLMLLGFTGVYFYASTHSGITDCGCFGNMVDNIPAWLTYTRNLLLLIACIAIILLLPKGYTKADNVRWVVLAILMTCAVYESGHTYKKAKRYNEKHPLYNQLVENTMLRPYIETHRDSTYLLYVFSYDCTTCIDGLNNIKDYNKLDAIDRLVLMPVNEDKDSVIHKMFDISIDEIAVGDGLQGEVTAIPVMLYIENNTVKYVIEGAVPSIYSFEKFYLN